MKFTILLISHNATRTGAPILLLNLADILIKKGYTLNFLLKYGGPLEHEFIKRGKTFIAHKSPTSIIERIKNRLKLFPHFNLKLPYTKYEAIISNTITNGDILEEIRKMFSGPIICYIHELKMAALNFTNTIDLKKLITATDLYAVPSEAVKQHLKTDFNIPDSLIYPLNYYQKKKLISKNIKSGKQLIVGGLGTIDWRKSPDLFIQTAALLFNENPDVEISFLWQGAHIFDLAFKQLTYDLEKSGLNKKITILGSKDETDSFYENIDILFLTSREDPYPLVVLEAAAYSIPTICFSNTGGAVEFITNSKGGKVVNYLNVKAAADAIMHYYKFPEDRIKDGINAFNYQEKTHQNEELILKQFENIIAKNA